MRVILGKTFVFGSDAYGVIVGVFEDQEARIVVRLLEVEAWAQRMMSVGGSGAATVDSGMVASRIPLAQDC